MSAVPRSTRLPMLLLIAAVLLAPLAHAQVTTGTLAGTVTTEADGSALPGVTVEAVHVPTGTTYWSVTDANGRYTIPNVRVGGPYTVTSSMDGFEPVVKENVRVSLGATTEVPLALRLQGVAESIVVTAQADVIDPTRTGSTSAVSQEQIETLPTVSRSLQDFARTNPYFTVDPSDGSSTRLMVAGRNNRYNTIQIDGAVNNDLFGLADTGTPGGQTDSQPITLDALQQIQLVVSPYDVRQGGFTGGGINVVTRSGTNDFEGSVFYTQRDESFVGDGPFDNPIANFNQDQYGGRFGGPILRDQLFFFLSGEVNRREQPTGWSADGSTGNVFNDPAAASELRDFLIDEYGYDPGGLGDIPAETNSDLAFGRLDWNIGSSNSLTLRHNYVDATRDVTGSRSSSTFTFPTAIYSIADETNSTVAQLNTVLSGSMFNEARIGFQTIRDVRDVPVIFPTVEIGGTGPRRGALLAGTERFSGANSLDQDILEITDDFTWIKGNHTLTIGTHNEIFEFKNLFLSEFYGYYYFPTFEAFQEGVPREYRISFANGSDPRRPTSFEVRQYGLYASDQWRVNDTLTLTLGLRGDMPSYEDSPSFNPNVVSAIGYSTAETPSEDIVWSPRVGFNWDPTGRGEQQFRGGVGIFAGRTPYVWISNAYANTGVETTALGCFAPSCTTTFNPDPLNQPKNFPAGGGAFSVDLIDPDFELPRVLRATLGYDRELPWNVRGTAELLWSQTQKDIFYYNVNKVQSGTSPLDGRPTFSNVSSAIRDAILLTNTGEGEDLTATLQLARPFSNGLTLSASYSYQDAESAMEGTSSRAISNWQFRPSEGDIFEHSVATSSFQIDDRMTLAATYSFPTGPVSHSIGLFYNAQSGRPYSILVGGDPNTDGYTSNDLIYIPGSSDEIIIKNSSGNVVDYSEFAAFLESAGIDPTSGRVLSRNESEEPWSRQLDLHYELGLPVSFVGTQLTFDVMNLLNMIDSDQGVYEYVGFQTYTPVNYRGIDQETGKPVYQEAFNGALDPGRQFSTSDTRSRWQMRIGVRLFF